MGLARVLGSVLCVFVVSAIGGTAAPSGPGLPLLPAPSFQPALDEWLTVTTGPTRHRFMSNPPRAIGIAPQVWAITVRHSDLSALQPYSLGTGLLRLRRKRSADRGDHEQTGRPNGRLYTGAVAASTPFLPGRSQVGNTTRPEHSAAVAVGSR